ncbi:hypothetical protein B0T10DRAFT_545966 [Thelonectria olida]|uniref:Uncharacterized protein n=1 Tax=Thelonectria olida TaxID=1576542 RepID=A0A9P9AVK3_9HYPO|nr:hypothetical protein B0T10DRAFT_545966 [Thelonectria olida]
MSDTEDNSVDHINLTGSDSSVGSDHSVDQPEGLDDLHMSQGPDDDDENGEEPGQDGENGEAPNEQVQEQPLPNHSAAVHHRDSLPEQSDVASIRSRSIPEQFEEFEESDNNDADLRHDGIIEPVWSLDCHETCKPPWDHLHSVATDFKRRYLAERALRRAYRREILALQRRVEELEEEVKRLTGKSRLKTEPSKTWKDAVEEYFAGRGLPEGVRGYHGLVRLACRDNNMSQVQSKTHPDLRLRPPTEEEEMRLILDTQDADDDHTEAETEEDSDSASGYESGSSTPFRWRNKKRPPSSTPSVVEGEFDDNPFDDLDAAILVKILRMALVFNGEPVHAISRLDPHYEPSQAPTNCSGDVALLHRFHIGSSKLSLSCATNPQALLAPLLVCKKWNYIGAHVFYSQNRFCFSSLAGIKQRLQRVRDIEILWTGSQTLCFKPTEGKGKYTSRRTFPMMWLGEAKWIKTMVVYVQESSREYVRRQHEPRAVISYMKDKTKGLDYIHMLRGMEKIVFNDYDRWVSGRQKVPVRDFTFVMDANNAVRRPKTGKDNQLSKFRHLAQLVRGYLPEETVQRAVNSAVKRIGPNDAPRGPAEEVPLGPAPIVIDDSDSDDKSDDSGDSSDAESVSDDESDGDRGPRRGPGGGKGGSQIDSEDDSDDDDYRHGNSSNQRGQPRDNGEDSQARSGMSMSFDFQVRDGLPSPCGRDSPGAQTIVDLTRGPDDEAEGRGPPAEGSLFVRDETELPQPPRFVTKIETPDPPPPPPPRGPTPGTNRGPSREPRSSCSPSHPRGPRDNASTPNREVRGESSLFVTPTPYSRIVRSSTEPGRGNTRPRTEPPAGGSPGVIDLTGQESQGHKRTWRESSSGDERGASEAGASQADEAGNSDEKSPKRPRISA